MINLALGLCIGIILGILIDKYIFVFWDIKMEKFTHKETVECTAYQLEAQELVQLYQREYGEVEEKSPAIGFQVYPQEEEYYDDVEEKRIGF